MNEHPTLQDADVPGGTGDYAAESEKKDIETPIARDARPQLPSSMSSVSSEADSPVEAQDSKFEPIMTNRSSKRPGMQQRRSIQTEQDLFQVLSQRRTNASGKSAEELEEEHLEIEKLMTRMFGQARQEHSEEEKTRHSGVVFRDLTVKGVGLGASLQPTVGDIFL